MHVLFILNTTSAANICYILNQNITLRWKIFQHCWCHYILDSLKKNNTLKPKLELHFSSMCGIFTQFLPTGWFLARGGAPRIFVKYSPVRRHADPTQWKTVWVIQRGLLWTGPPEWWQGMAEDPPWCCSNPDCHHGTILLREGFK